MSFLTPLRTILTAGVAGLVLGGCATTSVAPVPVAESPPPMRESVRHAALDGPPAKPSELLDRPELTHHDEPRPAATAKAKPALPARKNATMPYGAILMQPPTNLTAHLRPGTGCLNVTTTGFNMELQDAQRRTVRVTDATEKNGLPSGDYRMRSCTLTRKDASGIEWRVRCYTRGAIRVNAGEATNLAIGPPLRASLTTRKLGRDIVQLELALTGEGGERYVPATGSAKTLKPPRFRVRDGRGNIIASGAFRYG